VWSSLGLIIKISSKRPGSLQKYHVTYPNGPDASGTISVDFGVSNVPATVFIDRSGVVVRQHLGPVDAKTLDAEIQQLLK
jgi:hypothetical protein